MLTNSCDVCFLQCGAQSASLPPSLPPLSQRAEALAASRKDVEGEGGEAGTADRGDYMSVSVRGSIRALTRDGGPIGSVFTRTCMILTFSVQAQLWRLHHTTDCCISAECVS